MKYKSIRQQLFEERRKREKAEADLQKVVADTDYIAMMCDVELMHETETEVVSDEQA